MIEEMLDAYAGLFARLAEDESLWDGVSAELVPGAHLVRRTEANATSAPVPEGLLHQPFERRALEAPEHPAVITPGRSLSYGQLERRSRHLASRLYKHGVRPGDVVAVVMRKGWEQVVAVLAILRAGAVYLPVDAALPAGRIRHLTEFTGARLAVTQEEAEANVEWPPGLQRLVVKEALPEEDPPRLAEPGRKDTDLAYVIFTSGSSGQPKGVMIDHRGALNTITDVNQRFEVGPHDVVFGISSLSFDLSVYDVLGTLAAGATLLLPDRDADRDPEHWFELVTRHGVTVWNSVPALLEMMVEHAWGRPGYRLDSLRLVLLSGDWIPVTLPERFRSLSGETRLISMGGATEASIWSILYPIGEVDPSWKSVPYGKAMVNQTMHVLDEHLEPCPELVVGEIYIGGIGLALGYWNNEEETAKRFVRHPRRGERLYRTGDLGRCLPDGNIEFIGREDLQVKVRGHRIELGGDRSSSGPVLGSHAGGRAGVR